MNIVMCGNFAIPFSTENHHAKSLESLGHKVTRLQEGITTREDLLKQALESDLLVHIHTHKVVMPGKMTWDYISRELKKAKIPFITYHLDLWFGIDREKDLQDDYYHALHHFFTVDKKMAEWLNKNTRVKGHYLPPGVWDRECVMLPSRRVGYDIVFTGSRRYHKEYPYRMHLVDFLTYEYRNKFLHIGNDGEIGQQRGMKLNQIYADAKIAVGDTLNIGFKYPYYFSDRLTEQAGRGAFQIFPNIKGVEDMYEDGKEIVLYEHGNLDDLKEKIDYYLAHPQEREAIRKAGFLRTQRDHTYISRWKTILETIKEK